MVYTYEGAIMKSHILYNEYSLFQFAFFGVINTMSKSNLGEGRTYLIYTSTAWSVIQGNQGKNMEAGTEAEALKECCLIT